MSIVVPSIKPSMRRSSRTVGVSDETDVNDPIGVFNPQHNPILVAGKIEHCAAVFENTRTTAAFGGTSLASHGAATRSVIALPSFKLAVGAERQMHRRAFGVIRSSGLWPQYDKGLSHAQRQDRRAAIQMAL
jgi:hypothetical protein